MRREKRSMTPLSLGEEGGIFVLRNFEGESYHHLPRPVEPIPLRADEKAERLASLMGGREKETSDDSTKKGGLLSYLNPSRN